tara:strand:+ start:2218 stop:3765 length:1548 start_codon:yes stop_codon:yes gene_type:complete
MKKDLNLKKSIDNDLQNVKAGTLSTPVNISKEKVQVDGDLDCSGNLTVNGSTAASFDSLSTGTLNADTLNCPDINATQIDFSEVSGEVVGINNPATRQLDLDCNVLNVNGASNTGNTTIMNITGNSSQDVAIVLREGVSSNYHIGIDESDSDKLKIGQGAAVGTASIAEMKDEVVLKKPLHVDNDTAAEDNLKVFADESNPVLTVGGEGGNNSTLKMYENGGESTDDFFKIQVTEHGETVLSTTDAAGADGDISLNPDGDIILNTNSGHTIIDSHETVVLDARDTAASGQDIIFKQNGVQTAFIKTSSLNLKEVANANADSNGYGQIWIKNDTPNNLYFTDDTGQDVQLTNNGATVDNRWRYHQNARFYTRYDNWYYPSSVYGMNSVNWSLTSSSATKRTTWLDAYNPGLVMSDDITLTEYYFYGNFTSSQTYELCMLKGTGVTPGSAGDFTLSDIGSTQSVSATSGVLYKIGETGLSVSLSEGDIIVPALRRTTTDTSTYYYFEFSMNLKGVYQ